MMNFDAFFRHVTKMDAPLPWQHDLGERTQCHDRLIRIPTGMGKTLGVLTAWLYHRVARADDSWPRRLVWCLPMRVLVEQLHAEVGAVLARLSGLGGESTDAAHKVEVHLLMGGIDQTEWYLAPEQPAVLIGTQDMLLSRALNRGYAAPRARWPMEFGLLNQDCLWVLDEVQLMDVGFATSGQLQAFRREISDPDRSRPVHSWWMSATLQRAWLDRSPETKSLARETGQLNIDPAARCGELWEPGRKRLGVTAVKDVKALAKLVAEAHLERPAESTGPTLAIVNTVDRAVALARALQQTRGIKGAADLRLAHSRFRPHERAGWRGAFLNRESCGLAASRIIVATQVVEAGVDISASLLVTELAPWASLVQRFGRSARWSGTARVIVADFNPQKDDAAAPYSKAEIDAARDALRFLESVGLLELEQFEQGHPELLAQLYPYAPRHLLLRHEIDELFDTTPDLSGADVDVSRFIRSGDERDVLVFWDDIEKGKTPAPELQPPQAALCPVPFLKVRAWLCEGERLKSEKRAWVWDWIEGTWQPVTARGLYPGRIVLVASDCGGYDPAVGWEPDGKEPVPPLTRPELPLTAQVDNRQDDEALGAFEWRTIATHGREVGAAARAIAERLAPELADTFEAAGHWHDVGKSHPAFQGSIRGDGRPARQDIAKAPAGAWLPLPGLYPMPDGSRRSGLRHELASTLAMFAVLRRAAPNHPALLGPWPELLRAADLAPDEGPAGTEEVFRHGNGIAALAAEEFDLIAYLVCAHHGKVRLAMHPAPADQVPEAPAARIRGIQDGDRLPDIKIAAPNGGIQRTGEVVLSTSPATLGLSPLTGMSWSERVLDLIARHGPFRLAWLEAIFRAADQRASRIGDTCDRELEPEVAP